MQIPTQHVGTRSAEHAMNCLHSTLTCCKLRTLLSNLAILCLYLTQWKVVRKVLRYISHIFCVEQSCYIWIITIRKRCHLVQFFKPSPPVTYQLISGSLIFRWNYQYWGYGTTRFNEHSSLLSHRVEMNRSCRMVRCGSSSLNLTRTNFRDTV